MYEDFFGLSEKPFALTPNPRFVFQSEQYRAAEEALVYGISQKEGFMLVTGAPGTGKTTLCRDLLEKLSPDRYRVALIFNPFMSGVEMLQALVSEFGLGDANTTSRKELVDRLNAYLLKQLAEGHTCIAIFDEAQHLSNEFLEQIRVLSNLETDREKLIQIILVGQPELLALVRTQQMAQLDQRVSVRCTLTHLSLDETGRYIYHRLNVAGAKGRIRFSDRAVGLIHLATGGVPRLINLAADRALLAAYTAQMQSIEDTQVRQAIASLRGEEGIDTAAGRTPPRMLSMPRVRPHWWAFVAAAALIMLAVFWWQLDGEAELLGWKAARAQSLGEAERIYERIVREHPASRLREGALLHLAQLQIAKGGSRRALDWLDVLGRDYPAGAGDIEREYWTARALLANGDTVRACALTQRVGTSRPGATGTDFSTMSTDCVAFDARARADSARSSDGSVADSAIVRPAGAQIRQTPRP